MGLIKFYTSEIEYENVTPDGWIERYEYDVYLFDDKSGQIIKQEHRGLNNARNPRENYNRVEGDKIVQLGSLSNNIAQKYNELLTNLSIGR